MVGADDCWTDHRLLVSRLCLRVKSKRRNQISKSQRKLDTSKLKMREIAREYSNQILNSIKLTPRSNNSIDQEWSNIKSIVLDAATNTLGYRTKKNQDWFCENDNVITGAIEMKRRARLEWERHKSSRTKKKCFHQAKSHCQSLLREVENTWWKEKAQEIQNYADKRDLKNF